MFYLFILRERERRSRQREREREKERERESLYTPSAQNQMWGLTQEPRDLDLSRNQQLHA